MKLIGSPGRERERREGEGERGEREGEGERGEREGRERDSNMYV